MEKSRMIISLLRRVEETTSRIAAVLILGMGFFVTADIIARYVFKSPIIGAYELISAMLVLIVFLGVGYGQSKRAHVKVEAVTSWMCQRAQLALDIFGLAMFLLIMALITWRSGLLAWEAWVTKDHTMGAIYIPFWPGKSIISFGAGLLCLRLMADIIESSVRLARAQAQEREEK